MTATPQRTPIFRVKEEEGILELVLHAAIIAACILGMVYFLIMVLFTGWDNLVMFFFCLLFFFLARPGPKEFILHVIDW